MKNKDKYIILGLKVNIAIIIQKNKETTVIFNGISEKPLFDLPF